MKEEFITEEEIDPQIKRLFRMGLVNKDEMQKALRAFKNPEKSMQNKELRAVMMKVLQKVLKTVENDPSLFQKMKGSLKNVSETVIDEKLDPVNKKAVKKDFDDRKDKDIDNDGDVDDSDEYLHKKRKAISKAMKKEEKLQKINDKIKENKAKYDGRTRDGKSFVERITNNRLKREEKKGNDDQEKKTMTDKPANQIKIHGIYK
jgi:vacuolar-type H+-ATPase subunit I/STV1